MPPRGRELQSPAGCNPGHRQQEGKAGELSDGGGGGDDGNQYSILFPHSVIDGLVCSPANNEMSPLASRHSQS